uniref:HECT and RLD domain containing E3 ubiquitin protein ligase 4 n=1 Tax=Oncorhynchus mykiss TaxID=8022 RepID=A0A8C7RGK9_ONCMY
MLCWGNASFGQLGLGGIDEEIVVEPRKCDFFHGKQVCDIGCGRRHTTFLLGDGTVYTCGCNDIGQLGHEKSRKKPEQVVALDAQNIVAVSCGEAHTLALNDKGQVFAWGLATDGQLGLANFEECVRVPRNIKSLSDVEIAQVACGYRHSHALSRGGQVYSWGQNRYGQLGLGVAGQGISTPQVIQSLQGIPFIQISAGGAHSFALTFSGAVFGWGRNKFGQLGLNDNNDRYYPAQLKSLRSQRVIYICCGEDHTAALTKEGGVFTFGAGGYGQLGHNTTNHEINPRKVFELMGNVVTQISCGRYSTLSAALSLLSNVALVCFRIHKADSPSPYFCYVLLSLIHVLLKRTSVLCSHPDHYNTSSKCSGVDMNMARLLFHRVVQHDYPEIAQQIAASLEKNLIPRLSSSPPDIEALRLYLTLPECPLFSDPNTYVTLAIPFAKAFISLKEAPLKVLGNWWSQFEAPVFQRLVELYKVVVVYLLKMHKVGVPHSEQRVFTCFLDTALKLLEILHAVNERAGHIIQYDKFYIHELDDLIDIRNDYITWIQQQMYSMLLLLELLDPKYGMFRYYEESRLIWFANKTFEDIDLFHLIGVICGLAIYNLTIVDLHFPVALYKKLLKRNPTLDDLKELMPDVGRSLQQLLDYTEDDVEDTFCLNFTVTVENFGATEVLELVPNGMDICVDNSNRPEFVSAYVDYIFNKSVAALFESFFAGFHKVCGGKVLELFQPNELQAMVIGNTNYDWKELEKVTEYKGEYWAENPTIKFFWEVFHDLSLEKKKLFLLFLTGSDRIPILGMKSLKLVIQPTGGGEHYLPVAHTCFNLLDLPKYSSRETLQNKLLQAIDHNQGFNLA